MPSPFRFPSDAVPVLVLLSALFICVYGGIKGCRDSRRAATAHDTPASAEQIEWKAFSHEAKAAHLASGKDVIVFVYAELSPESSLALERLDSSKLARLSPTNEYVALLLKYSEWSDPDIRSVWRELGHTKQPFIAFYPSAGPPVRLDPFTLKELVVKYNLPAAEAHPP